MSPEVGDSWETLAYFCFMLRALLLSACCASADLSSQGGIAIAIICLCQTIVFENKFSDIVRQTQQSLIVPPFAWSALGFCRR
jgi:hypothetical protein